MTEFISRKYGNEGYEVIINTDCHEHYRASEEFARRLIDHAKPMTNADRIRAMTDEELIAVFVLEDKCPPKRYASRFCDNCDSCKDCWLDWLQQPAEEKE
jgi:hypothetical protein